jgi:thioredoxin reductase
MEDRTELSDIYQNEESTLLKPTAETVKIVLPKHEFGSKASNEKYSSDSVGAALMWGTEVTEVKTEQNLVKRQTAEIKITSEGVKDKVEQLRLNIEEEK